ncbi:MAG: hypothetical protein HY709_11260 [Candidatus Latescibacteria bacterium]|nr:hypothetical protein [Candidatus Latescibacterota bacterium]
MRVDVRYVVEEVVDRAAQICRNKLLVDVNDRGEVVHLESVEMMRVIFPQEFLLLVEKSGAFEFIGWWNNWDLNEPVGKVGRINRPITLIRRL